MRFWSHCGLQTVSDVRSDLRFEIYGPSYICYHVCLNCFGPFLKFVRKTNEEESLPLLYNRVVDFTATKIALLLPWGITVMSDFLDPKFSFSTEGNRLFREFQPHLDFNFPPRDYAPFPNSNSFATRFGKFLLPRFSELLMIKFEQTRGEILSSSTGRSKAKYSNYAFLRSLAHSMSNCLSWSMTKIAALIFWLIRILN